MPKSKRSRVVHLTQTQSRGRGRKSDLMDTVHQACDDFKQVYVFSCENMRSEPLKRLRADMDDTRFIYGKNKVVCVALGKTKEEAYLPGLEKLAQVLKGDVGLIFTNEKPSVFEKKIKSFTETDFARAGFKATEDIKATAGPLENQPSSMYEPLRKMQLPVKLNKGVIELENDHWLCRKGDVLSPEQAQALKFFGYKLATFSIRLEYRWRGGELTELAGKRTSETGDMEESEEEDF
mmetsp:Transcript_6094/g.10837  ORF Transcript_6094/g.10837 Transcript_6094/m.10837 type:complete len:236 (+) Transcript_6094:108-815(+)